MIARRPIVRWLASTPLALLLRPGVARAERTARVLGQPYDGEPFDAPGPGLEPVLLRGGYARLGAPLAGKRGAVFSISNANDRYVATIELSAVPLRMSFLAVEGGVLRADSWGTGFGDTVGEASYHVDRALADQVAKIWKVPRRDRTRLGAGLVGRFRPKAPLVAGAALEIVLEVRNGGAPVGFSVGGRQRGPRDNRFAFTVTQNGKPLPVLDAMDFGGLMQYREIKPGEATEVTADHASWVRIPSPGAYRVACSYTAELALAGTSGPTWPDHGHETWDLTLSETIDVTVS
jgi:hypothetical protein